MKELKCSYCHKKGHDSLHCYKRAWDYRLNRGKMRSKPTQSRSKVGVKQKMGKLSSDEKNKRRRLIRELDRLTSLYVRLKNADANGYVNCYICGIKLHYTQMDCNHWQKRSRFWTRFDLRNVVCGCRKCNRELNGNYEVFTPKIRAELGEEEYWKLVRESRRTDKIPTYLLEEWLESRRKEYNSLIRERKEKGFSC